MGLELGLETWRPQLGLVCSWDWCRGWCQGWEWGIDGAEGGVRVRVGMGMGMGLALAFGVGGCLLCGEEREDLQRVQRRVQSA